MSAHKIQDTIKDIEQNMTELAPYRRPELFNKFLVKGYSAVTLSSVPLEKHSDLLRAKICLGTLITLYDDFADRPNQYDPQLLEILYRLEFGNVDLTETLNPRYRRILDYGRFLFTEMTEILSRLPNYRNLIDILNFDLRQFYSANHYSSLLTANPYINNPIENRLYTHHNMGMVIVATMDLMATDTIHFSEFGSLREVFVLGQRMGRIFNVITTRHREATDGDITGELATFTCEQEILIAEKELMNEISRLHDQILALESRITTFSVKNYLEGLIKVQKLHTEMRGIL